MVHRVTLSNGRVLLIEEDARCLTLADEEPNHPHVVGSYICQFSADGVLVYPNSGCATEYLTDGLTEPEQKHGES